MRKLILSVGATFIFFITATAQTPSVATSTVTVSLPGIPAGGTSTITVQLKQADGTNLTSGGATVSFVTPSSGSIGSVTDNNNGTYTAIYTASTTTGTVTITPRLTISSTITNFTNTATVIVGTSYILDGTSGSNTGAHAFNTNGNINLGLGFFVDYLFIGGGGGGGTDNAGGGGAGGVLTGKTFNMTTGSYEVTVGAGGAGGITYSSSQADFRGVSGGESSLSLGGTQLLRAFGGGGGAGGSSGQDALSGGSGGGGAGEAVPNGASGTPGQGFAGGNGVTVNRGGGGGGGAGGVGANANGDNGGNGGPGLISDITGVSITYAGGGGGATERGVGTPGSGGTGGGGAGDGSTGRGGNGTANTGGGGGGATWNGAVSPGSIGGTGGSGLAIIRYAGSSLGSIGGTVTAGSGTASGFTIHTFNTSGSFNMSGVSLDARLRATLSGNIIGTGNLIYNGPGILSLTGTNNTYSGTTSITAGALNIRHASALGTTANGTTVSSGAALELQGGIAVGAEPLTLNGTGVSSGGALRNISGNNSWGGTVTLASASSIHSDADMLTLNAANAVNATNTNLTVAGAGNTTITGTITTGTGTLTKAGTGTLTISANNTYSGATTVSAGELRVNGSIGASSGVSVAAGSTISGGGTLPASTITGTHAPGNSPGIQTVSGNLTYNTAAAFQWELIANDDNASDRGTDFDGVNVTSGALTIGTGVSAALLFNTGGSAVDFTDVFWKSDHSWLVFDNANAPTLTSATNIFDNITVSNDKNNVSLTSVQYLSNARFYFSKVGNDVYLNYDSRVPETSVSVTSVSAMSSCTGTPSSAQTFTVSGQFLASNITVTAPTGFEVSLNGTSYAATQTISPSAGSVTATTVHVRITSAASGSLSGSVSITADGAETKLVSVSGLAGTSIASNAGTDIHGVPNLAKTLAANAPAVGTGAWSIVSGPNANTTQFSNTSSNTSSFTPTAKGNYVLRWTINSGTCTPTTDDVTVKVVDDIWLGTVSSDFNNPANWASGTVPAGGASIDFVVDPAATRNIVLTAPLTLGSFDFNGTSVKLVLGNHDATIGTISNPSTTAYIQTNGTGKLKMDIANGSALLFPIGTSHYSPVTITNRTGQPDQFFASVSDGVYTDGNTSGTLTGSAPRVDLTWQIGNTSGNTGSGSVDLIFAWQNPQLVGVLSNPKLFHHNATQWNKMTAGTTTYPVVNSLSYTSFTGSFTRSFSVAADDAVLPVTWLSFTGKKVAQGIELNWSTSSEQNTKDFQVQHSINAQQWTGVGNLPSAGNSNTVRNYRFVHEGPFKNSMQHYYRILQRDLDGKFSYSKVIRIEYPEASTDVVLYPNPTSDVLHVNLTERQELRLINMQGIVVWKGVLPAGRHEIPVSHFATGNYILQVGKGTYKVMIQ